MGSKSIPTRMRARINLTWRSRYWTRRPTKDSERLETDDEGSLDIKPPGTFKAAILTFNASLECGQSGDYTT
jgi:hypothetical protein